MRQSITEYGGRFMTDISYRTKIVLYASLSINVLYAAFKLTIGIYYASFWYGADAIYYIVLSTVRFYLLRYMRKQGDLANEVRQYRFCGYLLFILNIALIGVVYQVVRQNMGYLYPEILIYAIATYTFICLAIAIKNMIKYRKLNSPVLAAVKAVSFAQALVALFALQTSMLLAFGGGDSEIFKSIMKSLTGGSVCCIIFIMSILMIKGGFLYDQYSRVGRRCEAEPTRVHLPE